MDESNEVSLIKIAVVLVAIVLLLSASAVFYSFLKDKIQDIQEKEIENRKKQNQSIGYVIPMKTNDEVILMV
ncbi:MAG: hypothetical protein ACLR3R_19510 [Clostridium paraputrificum]